MFNPSKNEHTKALASYLPNGRTFEAKGITGSNLNQLLKGFASELFTSQGYLCALEKEYFPDLTVLFLDEWERAVAIPDDCLKGDRTYEERLRDLNIKLASSGIQTEQDFIDLAALYGQTIIIYPGKDVWDTPALAPGVVFNDVVEARYTIVVTFSEVDETFTYTFPFTFGSALIAVLKCLFGHLKPTNCQVLFQQV